MPQSGRTVDVRFWACCKVPRGDLVDMANRDWGGLGSLLVLVGASFACVYFFVFRSVGLIENDLAFWGLGLILIFVSFILSAVEAGFSSAPGEKRIATELTQLLSEKALKVHESDAEVHEAGAIEQSFAARRKCGAALRSWHRVKAKQKNLDGSGRAQVVGALSALNVISNTALATFLPAFLVHAVATDAPGQAYVSPEKMLIFISSALPILYFGKIIPKMVGLRYPYVWAYRAYWIGWASNRLIGWIPRGLIYGLIRIGLMKGSS